MYARYGMGAAIGSQSYSAAGYVGPYVDYSSQVGAANTLQSSIVIAAGLGVLLLAPGAYKLLALPIGAFYVFSHTAI